MRPTCNRPVEIAMPIPEVVPLETWPTRHLFREGTTRRAALIGLAAGLAARGQPARAQPAEVAIDTHAHIFRRGLKLADVRRYAPDYDATLADYLATLDANRVTHGVLVQPSFLGTDNSFLLEGLGAAGQRLRGIAVVEPAATQDALTALDKAGVVGVRLNLVGLPIPAFDAEPWPAFLKRVADLGWQVEVHREARDLEGVVGPLLGAGVTVVVDHFGRLDAKLGVDDPGFRYLLSTGARRRTWVKLSAPYRNGGEGKGERTAMAAYPLLRDALGVDRLVWGSDWPRTQFERTEAFAKNRAFLDALVPDASERNRILGPNAASLFRFNA
jgi:predicted TIM-barrel fold metal-dependent hydrolase